MGGFGLALGFSLSSMGFADWGEVHRMFTFDSLRLLFTFGAAVALTMAGFAILGRGRAFPARPIHRGSVAGGLIFGIGWAICGACPAASLVAIGEGRVPALFTLAGVVLGAQLHAWAQPRWFTWDHGTCEN
jgi:uncharacterized membrane protein YedE/YeeE